MERNGVFEVPSVAQFYDWPDRPRPDFAWCERFVAGARTVLDLGAGTGELALRLARTHAKTHAVTAVDPAMAMLDLGRAKPGADRVRWIEADARTLRLNARFDAIVLTGHTFQVFLADADQMTVLATIARHLAPDGRFVLDSRNPDFPGAKTRRREETTRRFDHPVHGAVEAWNTSAFDEASSILTYENAYRVLRSGTFHAATAQIRYTGQADLAARIDAADLAADRWLGDWHGAPFQAGSPETIPVARLT